MSDPDVSRAAVCVTANIMRNVPKTFFRSADGSHIASREASTEKQTAGAVNQKSPFVRSSPLFACKASAKTAIGTKDSRFNPCAARCSTPQTIVKRGMSAVPPAHSHTAENSA